MLTFQWKSISQEMRDELLKQLAELPRPAAAPAEGAAAKAPATSEF